MSQTFPILNYGTWSVVYRNLVVLRSFLAPALFGVFGEPLMFFVAMAFGLGQFVTTMDSIQYVQFLGVGTVLAFAMWNATFEATYGAFTRLEEQKTFDAILATPVTVAELAMGEIVYAMLKALVSSAMMTTMLIAADYFPWTGFVTLMAVTALSSFTLSAMALTVTAYAPSYVFFNYYFTLVITVMFYFGGVFYPIGSLPSWAHGPTWILPLTHATSLARGLAFGTPHLGVASIVYLFAIGFILFHVTTRKLRRRLQP